MLACHLAVLQVAPLNTSNYLFTARLNAVAK